MALFNLLVFYTLCAEVSVFFLTLVPNEFIPLHYRIATHRAIRRWMANDRVVWIGRMLLLLAGGLFLDTLLRLSRLDAELHHHSFSPAAAGHAGHAAGTVGTTAAVDDLHTKVAKFYAHRNLYLSSFTLVMVIVLWRRFGDMLAILERDATIVRFRDQALAHGLDAGAPIAAPAVGSKRGGGGGGGAAAASGGATASSRLGNLRQRAAAVAAEAAADASAKPGLRTDGMEDAIDHPTPAVGDRAL
ncbi:hypothetical protein CXG81DRAFT_23620 [Caulochytrium protostelioides]|uniref:BAP29/BAP31 transmembrane domain-containing protein n=1 Tax=Caulochytrium protostelioides TaxID=1555241 RepID=A0A4P9XE31_9FUNG|nr:hypothetical protein CXG81DRAFT_23620 [Caulochytrium protostelioides]|eukprot:RKP03785.1 hypothetical protein CXG81DRAFT_23620 [Caulochytrium protostelioides]